MSRNDMLIEIVEDRVEIRGESMNHRNFTLIRVIDGAELQKIGGPIDNAVARANELIERGHA
jgi:hypothetical protein